MREAIYELKDAEGEVVFTFAANTDGTMAEHISKQAEPKGMKVVGTGVFLSQWSEILNHIRDQSDAPE